MTMHRPPTPDDACGEYRGYQRHQYRNERACMACAEARRLYKEDQRLAPQRRAALAEAVGDGSYGGIAGGS